MTTGTAVTYDNGFGTNIGGLVTGGTYYLICPWSPVLLEGVCSQTTPTFRLATDSRLAHLDGFGLPGGVGPNFAVVLDASAAAGSTEHSFAFVDDPEGIGVGAGVAVNVVNDTGSATIGDGAVLTGAGNLTLDALTVDAMDLEARDGASGGIAVTPVVAVGISNVTTAATIGTGSLLSLAGALVAIANQTATLSNSAIGATEGKSVAIGASVSVGDSAHTVTATTARDLAAVGSATFTALSTSSTASYAYAGASGAGEQGSTQAKDAGNVNTQGDTQLASANAAATKNGAPTSKDTTTPTAGTQDNGGGSITVAAAISFNLVTSITDTSLPTGLHITVAGGPLTLMSQSNTDALATGDGEAGASSATAVIGAGVALNLATMTNTANLGAGSVVTADGVTLSATVRPVDTTGGTSTDCSVATTDCRHSFEADGISAAGLTGTLGVAGAVGINIVTLTTSAQALSDGSNPATIHAGSTTTPGDVAMTSGSEAATTSSAIPFRDQFDPATHLICGVDQAPTCTNPDTIVLDYELTTADGTPLATGDKITYFTDGGDPIGGLFNNTTYYAVVDSPGHIRLNWISATAATACAWDATLVGGLGGTVGTCLGIVTLDPSKATGTTHYITFGSDAAPKIGIGASFAFGLVNDTSTAGLQNGVVLDGVHNLTLTADSGSDISTLAVSGASGETTVGASVALTLANLTTTASVGTGATVDLTGNLEAEASQAAATDTVTRGDVDAESTGVGIALSLALVTNDVEASISRNIHADGDIALTASGSSTNKLESEASAPGAAKNGNTVNGFADSVLGHGNSTATDNGAKGSDSSKTPTAATSDGGGASLSVAGAAAIAIIQTTSTAWFADGLTIFAGEGPVTLASSARTQTESTAKGDTATATSNGVGAGVAVNYVVMHNIATTGSSNITGQGLVVTATMTPDPASPTTPPAHSVSAAATAGASNTTNIGVAGALAINIVEMQTQALVPAGATISAGAGDVVITAVHRETDTAAASSKAGFASCPVNNQILCTIKSFLPVSGTNSGTSSGSTGNGTPGTTTGDSQKAKSDSVGVGASVAVQVLTPTLTEAILDGVLTGGHDITVTATSERTVVTAVIAGAKGSDAVSPAVALVVDTGDATTARVGASLTGVSATGTLTISATHTADLSGTTADANAKATSVAVGAAVALPILINWSTTAELDRNVTATGVAVTADSSVTTGAWALASAIGSSSKSGDPSNKSADSVTSGTVAGNPNTSGKGASSVPSASNAAAQGSSASGGKSGSSSSGVGVGAAIAVTWTQTMNSAVIAPNLTILATGGPVVVGATQGTIVSAQGIGAAISTSSSGTTDIAAGIGFNYLDVSNTATVGSGGSVTGQGITVSAGVPLDSSNQPVENVVVVWGLAGAGGRNQPQIAGSVGLNVVTYITSASVGTGSTLDSTGDLTVAAVNPLGMQNLAAAIAVSVGGVGVGAAIAVNVLPDVSTTALVNSTEADPTTLDATGATSVTAIASLSPLNLADHLGPVLQGPVDDVLTKIGWSHPQIVFSNIAVSGAAASGDGAVAGSFIVNVWNRTTEAQIGDGARVNQTATPSLSQSLTVHAEDVVTELNISGSLGLSTGDVGVGVAVIVEVVNRAVTAVIGNGVLARAGGDITVSAMSREPLLNVAASAGASGEVGVAGSIIVVVINQGGGSSGTYASIDSGSAASDKTTVLAGGDLTVSASDNIQSDGKTVDKTGLYAGGASFGSSVGFGIAAVVLIRTSAVEATVGSYATIGGKALTASVTPGVTVSAAQAADLQLVAVSGAAGGDAGVAGSAVVDVYTDTTTANIGDHTTVNADNSGAATAQDVTISASDHTNLLAIAGGIAAGGDAGIGAGADVEVLTKDTQATTGSTVTINANRNVVVSADNTENVTSISAGGAFSGEVAISVNAAVSVFNFTANATIGDHNTVLAGGNVIVSANDSLNLDVVAGNISASGSVAAGAAVAVPVVTKTVTALIGSGATVTADCLTGSGTDINSGGHTTTTPDLRFDPRRAVDTIGNPNSIYIPGSAAFYTEGQRVIYDNGGGANIGGLLGGTDGTQGNVYYIHFLHAGQDYIQLLANRGPPNTSTNPVIALTLPVTGLMGENQRFVPADQASVAQDRSPRFNPSWDVSGNSITLPYELPLSTGDPVVYSSGGGTPIGGLVDGHVYYVIVLAPAGSTTGPTIELAATKCAATGLAADCGGTAGTVTPIALDNSVATGTSHSIVQQGQTPSAAGSSLNPASTSLGTIIGFHGISVSATSSDMLAAVGVSAGFSGSAAVNLSGSVAVLTTTTTAHIGDAAVIDSHGDLRVTAGEAFHELGIAATVAVAGSVGAGAGAAVRVVNLDTEATIGNGAALTSSGDTVIQAGTTDSVIDVAASVGGGGDAGISGSASITVLNVTTRAGTRSDADIAAGTDTSTGTGVSITAGNNVAISASDATDLIGVTASLGGGFYAGIGVGVDVTVVHKDTEARVGTSSSITANVNGAALPNGVYDGTEGDSGFTTATGFHGVAVQATSSEHLFGLTASIGGGIAGVSGSVGVHLITSVTKAFVDSGSTVDTAGNVTVAAADDLRALTIAAGLAGGIVGATGAVDIGVANTTVQAYLGDRSTVNADGYVDVLAMGRHHLVTVAASVGGGVVGIAASVSVWTIGTAPTTTYSDTGTNPPAWSPTASYGKGDVVSYSGSDYAATSAVGPSATTPNNDTAHWSLRTTDALTTGGANNTGQADNTTSGTGTGVSNSLGSTQTTDRGTWSAGTSYVKNDQVLYTLTTTGAATLSTDQLSFTCATCTLVTDGFAAGDTVTVSGVSGGPVQASVVSLTETTMTFGAALPATSGTFTVTVSRTDYYLAKVDNSSSTSPATDTTDWQRVSTTSVVLNGYLSSGKSSAATSVTSRTTSNVTGALQSTIVPDGISSYIGGTVNAGGHVHVTAWDDLQVTGVAGTVAGGLAAAGASVLVLNVGTPVSAGIGRYGSITAGSDVAVSATTTETVNGISFGGVIGAVSIGAQVVVINDSSSQNAHIDGGAAILGAGGGVSVTATATRNVTALAIGAGIGGAAAGAAVAVAIVSGDTTATVGAAPTSTPDATCGTTAAPTCVTLGGTDTTVAGLTVSATDTSPVEANSYAVQAGLAAGIAGSVAVAQFSGTTRASSAATGTVGGGGLTVSATGHHSDITANTLGVGVGGFAGIVFSLAQARDGRDTIALVRAGSLAVGGAASVTATATNKSTASAPGGTAGLGALAVMLPSAYVSGATSATVNGTITGASSATISADAENSAYAWVIVAAVSVAGGSGAYADAQVQGTADITAGIGSTGTVTTTGFLIIKAFTDGPDNNLAYATATAGGVGLAGNASVMVANAEVNGSVHAYLDGTASAGAAACTTNGAAHTGICVSATSTDSAEADSIVVSGSLGLGLGVVDETSSIGSGATTEATGASTASVNAGGDVTFDAKSTNSATTTAVVVSVGTAGVSAAVPTATVAGATRAEFDGSVTSATGLNLTAGGTNTATATTTPVAVGLVAGAGASAQAIITSDANVIATVGSGNVTVTTNGVDVQANGSNTATASANGGGGGGVAITAMLPDAVIEGSVLASFNAVMPVVGAATLIVNAVGHNTVSATSLAVSIGLGAGTGVRSQALVGSGATVSAEVGSAAVVRVGSGGASVTSTATDKATAEARGGSGGGVAIGAMLARAEDRGGASASFAGTFAAGTFLTVTATGSNSASSTVLVVAVGLAAGAGASACATVGGANSIAAGDCGFSSPPVTDNSTGGLVTAYIAAGAHITAPGAAVTVHATHTESVTVSNHGGAGGVLGVAVLNSYSQIRGATSAYVGAGATIGSDASRVGSLTVQADDTATASSESILGAGGVVAGGGSYAQASVTPTVTAYVGVSGTAQTIRLSGNLTVAATSHRAESNATAKSYGGGGVQVGVAYATVTTAPTVSAYIAKSVDAVTDGAVSVTSRALSESAGTLPDSYVANASHPVTQPDGSTAYQANVDLTTNTVFFQSHGLQTGDTVLYTGSGIGGLTTLRVYTVIAVDANHLAFGDTFSTGSVDSTDLAGTSGVDPLRDMIRFAQPHNFVTGDQVVLSGSLGIGGLAPGSVAYVRVIDAYRIQLYASQSAAEAAAVTFDPTAASGTTISLNNSLPSFRTGDRVTYQAQVPVSFDPGSVDVGGYDSSTHTFPSDTNANTIMVVSATPTFDSSGNVTNVAFGSMPFTSGQRVQYLTSGPVVGGLTNGAYYYVIVVDGQRIQLAANRYQATRHSYTCGQSTCYDDPVAIPISAPSGGVQELVPAPLSGLVSGETYVAAAVSPSAVSLLPILSYNGSGQPVTGTTPITVSANEIYTNPRDTKATITEQVIFGTQSMWATGMHLTASSSTTPPVDGLSIDLTSVSSGSYELQVPADPNDPTSVPASLRTVSPPPGDGNSAASAAGGGGGAISVNVPTADAYSTPVSTAYLAGSVTAGGDVTVSSNVVTDTTAWVTNGSGGVIAVGVTNASVTINSTSTALVGSLVGPAGSGISGDSTSTQVDGSGATIASGGNVAVLASSNHTSTDHSSSSGGGLVGAYTASATTTVTDTTASATGAGATISGDTARFDATSSGTNNLYTHAVMGALFGGTDTKPVRNITSRDIVLLDGQATSTGSITGRYGVDVRAHQGDWATNVDEHSACYCIGPSSHSGSASYVFTSQVFGHHGVVVHAGPRLITSGAYQNTSANATPSPLVVVNDANAAHLALYVQGENAGSLTDTGNTIGDTQTRSITWNSDVVINSGPDPYLLIDSSGNVVKAVNVTVNGTPNPNIGTHYTGTITVGDIGNAGAGDIWMTSASGSIGGGISENGHYWGTFTFHQNFRTVAILNNSNLDIVVQNIDVIDQTSLPHVTLTTGGGNVILQFALVQNVDPSLVVVDNTGNSTLHLTGTITNPLGETDIHATQGDILSATTRGGTVSPSDSHTQLIISNVLHLDAEAGSLGSPGDRINIDLIAYGGNVVTLTATAGDNAYLDLLTWVRDPSVTDPATTGTPQTPYVVTIGSLVAGNNLDVLIQGTLYGTAQASLPGVYVHAITSPDPTGTYYTFYHPDNPSCSSTPSACLFDAGVTGGNAHAVASTYAFTTLDSGAGTATGSVTVAAANDSATATRINVIGLVSVHQSGNLNVDTNGFITLTETAADSVAARVVVDQALSPVVPGFVTITDVIVPVGSIDMRLGVVRSTDDDVTLISPASIFDAPVGSGAPPITGSPSANVVGVNITMTAGTIGAGSIGTDTNFVEIDSSYDRFGVLNATAAGVIRITEMPSSPSGGYAQPGDLHVDTVSTCARSTLATCADITLTTTDGSILDGHNAGAGGTTVNVTGNSIDLLAVGGGIGTYTDAATGVFTGDLKLNSAAGSGCVAHYTLNYFQASAADRAVTANCHIAAQADTNIYLTELAGPADLLLIHSGLAGAGDLRVTSTETGTPEAGTTGNDIVVLHDGSTLVREPVTASSIPNTQSVPNGLVEADHGNVLLLSADDVVTDPSAQILATTDPAGVTVATTDPNQPTTTSGNIDIHGDWHPGVSDSNPQEGTVMVLRGEITPGTNGLTRIYGNAEDDQITFDQTLLGGNTRAYGSATATVANQFSPAGDGSDTLTVYLLQTMLVGTLTLDGQAGSDSYVIWTHGSVNGQTHYIINVLDSGAPADGTNTLSIYGYNSPLNGINPLTGLPYPTDDIFLLRASSYIPGESVARPGVYCGDTATDPTCTNHPGYVDVLHPVPNGAMDALDITRLSGYAGVVERINYDNAINGRLAVFGQGGNDHFAVDDNSATTTLDGGAGNDTFQIGQMYGMTRNDPHSGLSPPDYFPTIATTRGYLSEGTSAPLVALGGSGDDVFNVYSNHAAMRLEGNAGNDLFTVEAFALARTNADGSLVLGPAFTGTVTIDSGNSTITRSSGSFLSDGFAVGQTLVVKGAGDANDNTAATAYTISAVTATTITLARNLTTVTPLRLSGTYTVSLSSGPLARTGITIAPTASGSTITRTDGGSFVTDGFLAGQTIALAGTDAAHDNLGGVPYVITGVTASTLTISEVLAAGSFSDATVTGVLPMPLLTSGFSTAAQTDIRTGEGDNQVQYNINAPVSVDGGSGFNKLVVLGTEFADHIVVTADAIYGAGIQVKFRNIQVVEVNALQGDDTIDILSTAPGVVTRVVGGLGSDIINVAGDVVGDVVSRDPNGTSATINHIVMSGDPSYNGIVAPGLNVSVARQTQGAVIITESGGISEVRRQSNGTSIGTVDSYTVALSHAPTSDVWVTVSAEMSPQELRPTASGAYADTVYLCTTSAAVCATEAGYFHTVYLDGVATLMPDRALVLHFTAGTWNLPQTVWFAAANDTLVQGDTVVAISHSVISADPTFAGAIVRNVEVTVHDNLTPGAAITQLDSSGNPDGTTTVIKGTTVTQMTDNFTLAPPSPISGTVTYVITPSDSRVVLSSADGRFHLGPIVGGVQTYTVTFGLVHGADAWMHPVLITVTAVNNFLVQDPHYTTLGITVDTSASGRDQTYDQVAASLDVLVLDDNSPGVYVAQSGGSTLVSIPPGTPLTDTYSVRLLKQPTAPVTIGIITDGQTSIATDAACSTSTLGHVCLAPVDHLAATSLFVGHVTISGATITRAAGSELGSFITEGFAAGQLLMITGAGADSNTAATAYTVASVTAQRITLTTTLPAGGSLSGVTLSRVSPTGTFTGGVTWDATTHALTRTDGGSWLDNGFLEGQLVQISGVAGTFKIQSIFGTHLQSMSFTVAPSMSSGTVTVTEYAPLITFDQTNWWIPVTVTVSADASFILPPGRGNLIVFPKQPHLLSAIRGPVQVEGGTGGEQYGLVSAVIAPHEINTPPFGIGQQPSEARQIDVLNIYNDGARENLSGDLTSTALTGFGMGPSVTFPDRTAFGEPNSFPGGISYGTIHVDPVTGDYITSNSVSTIEILNIMLGQGNDTLTIHSTLKPGPDQAVDDKLAVGIPSLYGALTLVQGGGNALLQVTGTFDVAAGQITRTDGVDWRTAGFAIGNKVTVPGYALGAFTVTGFSNGGSTMLLSGATLTPVSGMTGTVSVYDPLSPETGYVRIGGDHIIVLGGGGPSSPLVIYGDTSQDGIWYSGSAYAQSGHDFGPKPTIEPVGNAPDFVFPLAQPFQYSGNDFIDASALYASTPSADLPTIGVTIYGGAGQDTIIGSQTGDILAGGSGNDLILGQRGRDIIYGDSGINVNVITRVLTVVTVNASALPNADTLYAGHDVLIGEGFGSAPSTAPGNSDNADVIFGDQGQVIQDVQGARQWLFDEATQTYVEVDPVRLQAIQTTLDLMHLATVQPQNGVSDTIEGDLGNDFLFGGGGGDTIWGNAGNDLVFGDFGTVDCVQVAADPGTTGCRIDPAMLPLNVPLNDHVFTWSSLYTGPTSNYGNDLITGDSGNDILIGGAGSDRITGGAGDDDIIGGNTGLPVPGAIGGSGGAGGWNAGVDYSAGNVAYGDVFDSTGGTDGPHSACIGAGACTYGDYLDGGSGNDVIA
ncbi:MAG: hypothetical protein M0Z51_18020, partial [Propionibacterium sp.]|nr:hypothetical protein [Propionibacterium sp.]